MGSQFTPSMRNDIVPAKEPSFDPEWRYLPWIGQINPNEQERLAMMHGRHLSGLGAELMEYQAHKGGPWELVQAAAGLGSYPDAPEAKIGAETDALERLDDVYGSGIFDPPGSSPTVSPDLGVFAAHYNLPGYIGRETQYAVSTEIYDYSNDADFVAVAGGGMAYIERDGHQIAPEMPGFFERPVYFQPQNLPEFQPITSDQPAGPVSIDTPYTGDWGELKKPAVPIDPVNPALSGYHNRGVRSRVPYDTRLVRPLGHRVPAAYRSTPVQGLGADAAPPSFGTMLLAGAIVGGAAALLYGAYKASQKRAR